MKPERDMNASFETDITLAPELAGMLKKQVMLLRYSLRAAPGLLVPSIFLPWLTIWLEVLPPWLRRVQKVWMNTCYSKINLWNLPSDGQFATAHKSSLGASLHSLSSHHIYSSKLATGALTPPHITNQDCSLFTKMAVKSLLHTGECPLAATVNGSQWSV